jgi:hypothetical protein
VQREAKIEKYKENEEILKNGKGSKEGIREYWREPFTSILRDI